MTSDTYVGGVPNTPEENEYPSGACTEPEGRLGLTVGWGDQYDATDGGEGIEITGLPNGTYWLRGEVDPYHYLQESNTANDITDTKIKIEGETVKVIEQVHTELDAAHRHPRKPGRRIERLRDGRRCPRPPAARPRSPRCSSCSTASRSARP